MKHLALLFLAACATTPTAHEPPARVWDFGERTLAQLIAVPSQATSPKSQVQHMLGNVADAIAACKLSGTFQLELTIEDGALDVVVNPDAPCLHDAIDGADPRVLTVPEPVLVEMPLVLDSGYAAAR